MTTQQQPVRVSAHGGHSGQFCLHARDTLAQMVEAYATQGFGWVGLSEHMPPPTDDYLYPDEAAAGLHAGDLKRQFANYVRTARGLQREYAPRLKIRVAMEGEFYPGAVAWIRQLQQRYVFDYIVGSVHHVDGCCFDFSPADYATATARLGGIEALYCGYFDAQLAMIEQLRPAVVGHFDLIRLHDPDYARRFMLPEVAARIERNLQRIAELKLILDYNMRALAKGAAEPYVAEPILRRAVQLGIDLLPGDDSHGVASVGNGIDDGIRRLQQAGYHCRWRQP